MKTHILTLAAIAALSTLGLADSPDAILKDYQAKAAPALEKVNARLEKATVPLIADLVKAGETAAAGELKAQLKAKQDGEPVMKPHSKAVSLFALYDAARIKALEPALKSAVNRIETLLTTSEGKKLDVVEALGKVRAEIEAGKVGKTASFPLIWTYHRTVQSPVMSELKLEADGTWKLTDPKTKVDSESGTWVQTSRTTLDLDWKGVVWKMSFDKKEGVIDRPDIGKRYLKLAVSQ